MTRPTTYFDAAFGHPLNGYTIPLTNECLLMGDWAKGQAGTGEASWIYFIMPASNLLTGCLAESWEVVQPDTLIYHIRRGVHFHDKPPTSGRVMTADDVVFSLVRLWQTPTSYIRNAFPWETNVESITAPDKWTVVIRTKPGKLGPVYEMAGTCANIVPRDMVEKYGNMADWKNSCGTGPFVLTDHVSGSSITLTRNPYYWMKDPLHPENTLPYLDGLKCLSIPDMSTLMAGVRTGKIDRIAVIGWEDAGSLLKTNPELQYVRFHEGRAGTALYWRVDTKPFDDVRVRQALTMAVNFKAIKDDYFKGNAEVLSYPVAPVTEFEDIYIPLDKLPESIRELFEYHPDKAKQLLAEAGYPNGFKTEVVCWSTYVDLLSIVKNYWADIGVDLKLDVREYGVWTSIGASKAYKMFAYDATGTIPFKFGRERPGSQTNQSMVNDPVINKVIEEVDASYFDEPKRRQLVKQVIPYMLEQAYVLQLLGQYTYTLCQPWVKNYHGENYVGYMGSYMDFSRWTWIDQDLKQRMTGRR